MKETTKAWIARDEDGRLCIYEIKPTKKNTYYARGGYWFPLERRMFPDLTFENSPKECEIAIKIKQ